MAFHGWWSPFLVRLGELLRLPESNPTIIGCFSQSIVPSKLRESFRCTIKTQYHSAANIVRSVWSWEAAATRRVSERGGAAALGIFALHDGQDYQP